MKCPQCQAWTQVLETRRRNDNTKRRTYECGNLHKFSTIERIEPVKHGGARPRRKAAP